MIDFTEPEKTGDLPPVGEILASMSTEDVARAETLLRSFAASMPKALRTILRQCVGAAIARGRLTRRKAAHP